MLNSIVTEELARQLFLKTEAFEKHARRYLNGQDVARTSRGIRVLDFFGLKEAEIRSEFPEAYQYLLTHTKKERAEERNPRLRTEWWLFEANRPELRRALLGLKRYIVTVENSPLRYFTFLDADILPDQKLRTFASDDAFVLGILSTSIHAKFAERAGGRHGVGNTPVYNTRCANLFPFPLCGEAERERIRKLAEELDAHRKRVQAQHGLTLTGLYNVLGKIRAAESGRDALPRVPNIPSALSAQTNDEAAEHRSPTGLTDKEKLIHDKGLVSVLKQLHDDLDTAVFAAYNWPATLTDAEILERLVALNAERAAEEKRGIIHWLRPEYQARGQGRSQNELSLPDGKTKVKTKASKPKGKTEWPKTLADRVKAVEAALHAAVGPTTPAELAKQFKRAQPANVAEILETLVTLGRAKRKGNQFTR